MIMRSAASAEVGEGASCCRPGARTAPLLLPVILKHETFDLGADVRKLQRAEGSVAHCTA